MDKMLVIAFDSEDKAYQGARALQQLHVEGSIAVYAMAVVAKDSEGKVTVEQDVDQGPLGEQAIAAQEPSMDSRRRLAALRARAYMLENIDDAISVRRLSLLTGVSERTLRYGFQELYGMSPSKYLKAVRMQRVRQALRRAHSSRTTVLREAMRSGFWHLSRFSSEYKSYFGELPSATLRG